MHSPPPAGLAEASTADAGPTPAPGMHGAALACQSCLSVTASQCRLPPHPHRPRSLSAAARAALPTPLAPRRSRPARLQVGQRGFGRKAVGLDAHLNAARQAPP